VKGLAEVAISMSRGVIYGRGQNREPVLYSVNSAAWVKGQAERVA